MADIAVGAVTKLLGVIHNETLLLGRAKEDVQFIKEEMESINSFLARLATAAAGAQDDEQMRTWMKQVRDLARDCSNCIDLYVQCGDPTLQRARARGVLRYLWRASWFVQKMVAQHSAAVELGKLKERARDVSERRSRYDVKMPEKEAGAAAGPSSQAPVALAAGDDGVGGGGDGQRRRALEPRFLEDHFAEKLAGWLNSLQGGHAEDTTIPSIAIVAPGAENSGDMARDALGLVHIQFDPTVWINLQQVHGSWDLPLLPHELLCHILQKCDPEPEPEADHHKIEGQQEDTVQKAFTYRSRVMRETEETIEDHKLIDAAADKIEEIKSRIGPLDNKWSKYIPDKPFAMLYQALLKLKEIQATKYMTLSMEQIVMHAASMLKWHMEAGERPPVVLDITQYKEILQEVFLDSKPLQQAAAAAPAALSEDVVKQINNIIQQLLPKHEPPEGNSHKEQKSTAETEEAKQKVSNILWEFQNQLFIKGIVDRINKYPRNKKILIILQDEGDYISSRWKGTRKALSLIDCKPGSAVIVTTENSQNAKKYCCPSREPITYSLVGLYHDIVLDLTRDGNRKRQQDGSYDPQILRDILDKCNPHEFAMKIFLRDLYVNPNRSSEDLHKLLDELDSHKSSAGARNSNIANMTMLKFSYNSLPREFKTCFMYLAIFPPGYSIRRSTLVGRWAAEGLITKEDWASAVHHGERCFDTLIDRGFLYPTGTDDATGEVKNYIVGDLVHEFISKIAKKEHILDARLSHEWARHFSVFSDLRLCASDCIEKLLRKLPKYAPQLQLLKVLDLQGCEFYIKKIYLKNICNNIPLLKYLSLQGTKVKKLPCEINNLHELEILDIRQTDVPAFHTGDVLLLKLKRLLAGPVHPSPSSHGMDTPVRVVDAVQIPSRIKKMDHMEVLSNVIASRDGDELEDIRKLFRLRKLGVVIEDKEVHLRKLLRVISDLKDRIQFLSVTLQTSTNRCEGTPHSGKQLSLEGKYRIRLEEKSKRLESLSINGVTDNSELLSFLTKGGDRLAKVNLKSTLLNQKNMEDLAALPKLCCVRLQDVEYTEPMLNFKKHHFPYLKCFIAEDFRKTNIIDFGNGTAPELEKITLSLTSIKCLCGAGGLRKLKELQLKGNKVLVSLLKDEVALDDGKPCTEGMLAFKKEEFQHLEDLLISAQLDTDIIFEDGATPELRKIVLALENIRFLRGVGSLRRLTELELTGHNMDVLLPLLNESSNRISKVTLSNTLLNNDHLQALAKKPNLHCLELLNDSYMQKELGFNKDDFPKLTLLIVDCPVINKITFEEGAAPKMEKITWTFSKMESLSGIKNLPKLNRLKLFGDIVPYQVTEDIKALRIRYTQRLTQEQQQQLKQAKGEQEDPEEGTARFPFSCFTSKNRYFGASTRSP